MILQPGGIVKNPKCYSYDFARAEAKNIKSVEDLEAALFMEDLNINVVECALNQFNVRIRRDRNTVFDSFTQEKLCEPKNRSIGNHQLKAFISGYLCGRRLGK